MNEAERRSLRVSHSKTERFVDGISDARRIEGLIQPLYNRSGKMTKKIRQKTDGDGERKKMIITDIHMHIIPGVDDGSRSLEESVAMLRVSSKQGVSVVVATPHSWGIDNCGFEKMHLWFEELRRTIIERQIPVQLYLGCEMLVFSNTVDDCVRKLKDGRYPTLAGSRFVLTEFDPYETPDDMKHCAERIIAAGYVPVIAHAERYRMIAMPNIRVLKDLGAMVQINAYSIANESNTQTRHLANSCLSERLVDFLGSDAHRLNHRPPLIKDGVDYLIRRYTEEYAKQVAVINPQLFLK